MRIIYSDEANRLYDMVEPYIEFSIKGSQIKDDAPEEIKKADRKWQELANKEYNDALAVDGLI